MQKIIILVFLSLLCIKTQAQNSAESKLGTWYMYNGSHKLSDEFALKTMAHFRYYEVASEFQQEIYRLGLNYKLNPTINFTLGYSYVNTDIAYNSLSNYIEDHRIYEDINLNTNLKKIKLKHRFRFEHRFFGNNNTRHWIRYDLNTNYPLSAKWSAYAFNEIFLHLDQSKVFAQNWTGAGFIHNLNKSLKLKLGYFQIKTPNIVLKRAQLGILINTDFSKQAI